MDGKDFITRLQNEPEFAKAVSEEVIAKAGSDGVDFDKAKEILVEVAKEKGYELTDEQIEELQAPASEEMSEDELGKVAGGTSSTLFFTGMLVWATLATVIRTMDDD